MKRYFNLILVGLLLLCLADMPYGYYVLVRFISAAFFCYMAYGSFMDGKKDLCFVFVSLAVLFQPFLPINLGRVMWNVVDVIIAIVLIIMFIKQNNSTDNSTENKEDKNKK